MDEPLGAVVSDQDGGLTQEQGLLVALALTGILVLAHLFASRIRRSLGISQAAVVSLAGGISVAYVFLHLLPEVAAGGGPIGATLEGLIAPTRLHELAAFAVALIGFTVFYGLERLAERSRGGIGDEADSSTRSFTVHVGAFALYNGAITYTLPLRVATDVLGAALFTIAIGVHVLVVDRGLAAHYPRRFRAIGRFVLAGALVVGWSVAALAVPTSTLTISLLTAWVAGSVLLTVFKEELPAARKSRFGWFLIGLAGYSTVLILLAIVTPVHLGD